VTTPLENGRKTMGKIRDFFDHAKEMREIVRRADAAIDAIDEGNAEFALNELANLKNEEAALGPHIEDLLRHAIKKDDTEIFSAVFEFIGNPNYTFFSHCGAPGGGISSFDYETILSMTISAGSSNIALILAENPETDIEKSGYRKTVKYYMNGDQRSEEKEDLPPPLDAARKKGMDEVVAILAERTADALTNRARALYLEARHLSPD
jgi:hypothetical protein